MLGVCYPNSVEDITGREVARLADGWKAAGSYREVWNGQGAASGSYYLRLASHELEDVRSIQIIR
jgi:hypothetical protein